MPVYPMYDKSREAQLMDILGIQSMDEVTIIRWQPPGMRPEAERYVLVKYYAPDIDEVTFELCAYDGAAFFHTKGDSGWAPIPEERLRGWAYPVYMSSGSPLSQQNGLAGQD